MWGSCVALAPDSARQSASTVVILGRVWEGLTGLTGEGIVMEKEIMISVDFSFYAFFRVRVQHTLMLQRAGRGIAYSNFMHASVGKQAVACSG